MKTKLEILKETAKFYNRLNRGYNDDLGSCEYLTPTGKKCAVGRCIREDLIEVFQMDNESSSISSEMWDRVKGKFKPEYQGHDVGFWMHLQAFHDSSFYWSVDGLTEQGQIRYEALKKIYTEN